VKATFGCVILAVPPLYPTTLIIRGQHYSAARSKMRQVSVSSVKGFECFAELHAYCTAVYIAVGVDLLPMTAIVSVSASFANLLVLCEKFGLLDEEVVCAVAARLQCLPYMTVHVIIELLNSWN